MDGRRARMLFLGICVALAILLLAGTISTVVSSVVFAVSLAVLGGFSRGFRRRSS